MTSVRSNALPEWRYATAAVLAGSLLTTLVTVGLVRAADDLDHGALDRRATQLAAEIVRVVDDHTAVLYGIRSLALTEGLLSRESFHRFVIDGGLLDRYPGAQAFEIAAEVSAGEVPGLEQRVRSDTSLDAAGYPGFAVHPTGAGELRWVVEYIEPMESNVAAFGLDLGAEAERRAALLDARDRDEPRTTGPIRLVQGPVDRAGLLVVLPIYEGSSLPTDLFARRRSTLGFALVVYRAGDMLSGVAATNDDVTFRIDDVGSDGTAAPQELHAVGTIEGPRQQVTFPIHGRVWSLTVSGLESAPRPWAFPVFGGLATVLLTAVVYHLAATRRRATARARVLAASDAQRLRLERDLHDGAQQRLLSVSLLLSTVATAPAPAGDVVRTARERVNQSLQELRELAHGIHPAAVTDHGLVVALEQLAARAPLPVRLNLDPHDELSPHVAVTGYYAAAEALTNVARHARATRATISLRRRDDRIVLTISDDGAGGASTDRGTGLQGLVDRVEAVGGRLTIASALGDGTSIEVILPCGS